MREPKREWRLNLISSRVSLTVSLDPHGEEAPLRRLRCGACHRARIRATRWHRRENHEAPLVASSFETLAGASSSG
jgi:hypothetical protein